MRRPSKGSTYGPSSSGRGGQRTRPRRRCSSRPRGRLLGGATSLPSTPLVPPRRPQASSGTSPERWPASAMSTWSKPVAPIPGTNWTLSACCSTTGRSTSSARAPASVPSPRSSRLLPTRSSTALKGWPLGWSTVAWTRRCSVCSMRPRASPRSPPYLSCWPTGAAEGSSSFMPCSRSRRPSPGGERRKRKRWATQPLSRRCSAV